jgi:hypothetical protein
MDGWSRLDSTPIGCKTEGTAKAEEMSEGSGELVAEKLAPGPITWHY